MDIQSHMTDQAQWLVGDGPGFDYGRDFDLEHARLWSTPVPLDLFRASTGAEEFPETLAGPLEDGVLDLACNGEIRYPPAGDLDPPAGPSGDNVNRRGVVTSSARRCGGERATIFARRAPETAFRAELLVAPHIPDRSFDTRLDEALAKWGQEFPGLSRRGSRHGHEIVIPDRLQTPHEAHFPMALDDFLDVLDSNEWPGTLAARIRSRYTLLARAHERGPNPAAAPSPTGS